MSGKQKQNRAQLGSANVYLAYAAGCSREEGVFIRACVCECAYVYMIKCESVTACNRCTSLLCVNMKWSKNPFRRWSQEATWWAAQIEFKQTQNTWYYEACHSGRVPRTSHNNHNHTHLKRKYGKKCEWIVIKWCQVQWAIESRDLVTEIRNVFSSPISIKHLHKKIKVLHARY